MLGVMQLHKEEVNGGHADTCWSCMGEGDSETDALECCSRRAFLSPANRFIAALLETWLLLPCITYNMARPCGHNQDERRQRSY